MNAICTSINQRIRSKLLERGLSLTEWARIEAYNPKTVSQTLWRYAGKDKGPERGIALSIIERLEAETGIKICG